MSLDSTVEEIKQESTYFSSFLYQADPEFLPLFVRQLFEFTCRSESCWTSTHNDHISLITKPLHVYICMEKWYKNDIRTKLQAPVVTGPWYFISTTKINYHDVPQPLFSHNALLSITWKKGLRPYWIIYFNCIHHLSMSCGLIFNDFQTFPSWQNYSACTRLSVG